MLTLQKAFSQLHLVASAAIQNAGCKSNLTAEVTRKTCLSLTPSPASQTVSRVCMQFCSTTSGPKKGAGNVKVTSYDPPSPYRKPGPRRYGYAPKFFTGGLLPRDERPIRSLPRFKPKDSWNRKRALFGQNDYIDILGDGSIKPVDLIHGPDWLIGFKGNELQRLVRRLNFHGDKLKLLYPQKYHNIQKRVFFLYKKYNQKRGKRVGCRRK